MKSTLITCYIRFRGQTTKGIWIAKCSDIDPFTIAMDFEGTDSNQRGEVTLRSFYYCSFALLIERVLWLHRILFNICDIQIVDYWMVSIFSVALLYGFNLRVWCLYKFGTANVYFSQDDTAFEKQSTLFALAIADVVLINMWVFFVHQYNIWMPFLPGKFDKCPQLGMALSSRN